MRRFSVLLSGVMLVGSLAVWGSGAIAQEATPAGEMQAEGVSYEPVSFATGVEVTSPADLAVFRIRFDPGAVQTFPASDPGAGILVVESGTFTVQVEGPVTVTRGAGLGAAMATAEATGDMSAVMESIPAGQAVTLEAGDAAYIPGYTAGEIRNEGQEPATGVGFLVFPSEDMTGEATPAP
jgi:quercetin dioxygenase-like cupin family protein